MLPTEPEWFVPASRKAPPTQPAKWGDQSSKEELASTHPTNRAEGAWVASLGLALEWPRCPVANQIACHTHVPQDTRTPHTTARQQAVSLHNTHRRAA
jgi:hypothetical protein